MSGKRMKKKKINIRKIFLLVLFIVIMFGVVPALSKYKGATAEQIITILTRYSVNYRTSGGVITEPEKFNSYVSQTGLTLPVEGEVTRTSYDFLGWYGDNDFTGEPVTKIESGETGDKLFFAAWQLAQYDLSVKVKDTDGNITSGLPSDYYIVIGKDEQGNDNVIDLNEKGTATVGKYQTVSIRTTYYEEMILGGFTFLDFNGEEIEIEITTRHQDGDQYIYYDFKMPRGNTTLLFTKENTYVDISKSPITFEENVNIDGTSTTQNGFWYNSTIAGMTPIKTDARKGRFYAWDYSEPFYVTSKGKETQNQLTLVNTITVYFKDCKLIVRDGIDMEGRKVNGQVIENSSVTNLKNILGDTLVDYGNIIINKDKVSNYTVNFYIEGDNTITTIFPNVYNYSVSYKGKINIYGEDKGKLYLGTILDNAEVTFTGVDLEEITEFESEYVVYTFNENESNGHIIFNYCNINIPNKRIYTYRGIIGYYSKGDLTSTTPTIADIGSSRQYSFSLLTGSSSVYVRNDLFGEYHTVQLYGNSKLIVEGNVITSESHWSVGANINTNGYVIVKGNRFDGENMTLRNGTVITNLLELGRTCNMIGGTLVTNLISNPVCLYPKSVDNNGNYINDYRGETEDAKYNDDDTTFLTRSQWNSVAGVYEFGGTNIYILGNYKLLETGTYKYDTSVKATDYDELNNIIEQLITSGKISTYPEMTESQNETIIIGNSQNSATYNVRTVKITGGNIYASGDITFFNDVTVTGGNINCTGIFSTKRNLEITGGTIDAKEIGNSYNLTNTNNGLTSWKTTTITGGTLNAERLGATSKTINTTSSNGTLIIDGSVQINRETQIVTDTYINYIYDANTFNNSNTINNIRFSGTQGIGTMNNIDKLEIISPTLENDQYVFSKPTINGVEQKWKYDSLNGVELEYLNKYGYINGETSNSNIYQKMQLNLYATKEKYNLTVHGSNYSGTSNGENIEFTNNIAEIKSGNQVILKVAENLIDKVVVWYKDNSGTVYNAIEKEAGINKENATITFNMPSADTEVWIVDGTEIESLTLDLSAYNVSILADGFATELNENRRDSSVFRYNGDITISQSNIEGTSYINRDSQPIAPTNGYYNDKVTYNKIEIEGTNKNKIVLKNVIQETIDVEEYAVIIGENVETNLLVDGAIQLKSIKLPGTSTLNITGENKHDVLYIKSTGIESNYRKISNYDNSVGSVYLKNLIIHQYQRGRLLYNNSSTKTEYLTIEDCVYIDNAFYIYSRIADNVNIVNIIDSKIELSAVKSYQGRAFYDVNCLNIIGGTINYSYGTQYVGFNFFSKVGKAELNNAKITEKLCNSTNTQVLYSALEINNLPETITLNGNSQINSNYRYIFRDKLILNDTSSVNIGDDTTPGYLFAPNIEVNDQAQINSANVILSGYYSPAKDSSEATTKSDAMKMLSTNTDIKDGEDEIGLVLNGGTVNAKEFVGGDVNATITINDGTINSSKIGTIGSLFGYAKYAPKVGEEYVYTYSKIPEKGTKVTVNGGTVNVLANGYLGGMNAEVDIKGGTINLKDNSIIGMTDSDTTKLVNSITTQGNTPNELVDVNITGGKIIGETGKINTAYSTLDIDATTSNPDIQIAEIIAENGTINIQSIAGNYDNPLGEGEKVGAVINENLIAQNIAISNGASVYAKNAITSTNTSSAIGSLKIGANSYLYTLHYGSEGSGTSTITNNGTIVGNRQYTIKYEMNDTYSDKAENTNPTSYIYGNAVTLVDPTRTGYNFEGWYDESGNKVTEITSTDSGDKVFYAKWTEKSVEFVVKIKASDVGISKDEFAKQVNVSLGTLNANGDEFTYTQKVSIKYHALFNTGLLLSNYNLASYSASGAKINNTTLNPDGDVLNLTSSGMTVTKEIMDYYIANKNEPIEILVCEFISNDIKTINIDE